MAGEIIKLDGNGINRRFIFLYQISPRKTYTVQGGSTNDIVPTPQPEAGSLQSDVLTTQQKNDLDTGDLGYEIVTIRINSTDLADDLVLIPLLQAEYAAKKAAFLASIDLKFARTGDKFDEV